MCYDHYHNCKYCGVHYRCALANKICPTINFDLDANMCDLCRSMLELLVEKMDFEDALELLRKSGAEES